MRTFSFIHAADLHLDTPFEGIAADAPEIRDLLVDASLRCWDALVSLAIEREVAFVLLAGDLYDGAERGIRAQFRVKAGLDRLAARGIRTFIVHGNHDPLQGWRAAGAFAPEVTVFGASDVQRSEVRAGEHVLANIYGISYSTREVTENLAKRFVRAEGEGLHIALLHCTVGDTSEHAAYSPCSIEDLRASGMDYWALGHIHLRSMLARSTPWVAYPGNLQGRSVKPSERGAKGVLLVHVDAGHIMEPEFVPLDVVRFEELRLDVTTLADVAAVQDVFLEELAALQAESQGRSLIVRTNLHGRSALHRQLAGAARTAELLEAFRHLVRDAQPVVWIESVKDQTRSELNRDAVLARGDFTADLLRLFDAVRSEPGERNTLLQELLAPALRRRLASIGVELSEAELREIVDGAEAMALDELESEPAA